MFKGLLDRAVDLSFEVDSNRRIQFLSPMDAFNSNMEPWIGRCVDDLFWPDGNAPARNPFTLKTQTSIDAIQVSVIKGALSWFSFVIDPWFDDSGIFQGVRGTCRDVTERIKEARQTRLDNLRLGLQQRITELLITAETSEELLDSASNELIEILRADLAWSVVKYDQGLVPLAICGDSEVVPNIDLIWRSWATESGLVVEVPDRERNHLAIRLEKLGIGHGMIVISRDTKLFPWSEQEKVLMNDVTSSLTAAFSKAQLINKLTRLSTMDELTGLSNRRAFIDQVERRLQQQCRSGHSGCLLFIDLDHFKEINDTLGHRAGDQAIRLVGETLQAIVRASDYAGRYGGDEFVVWLEDISAADAAVKARFIIDAMPGIRDKIGGKGLRLSASVGVCASIPEVDLNFASMAEWADAALYEVKNAGRGSVAIAVRQQPEDLQHAGA
jgi:diguanylate cyclase (GGDEF)-like protein